MKALVGAFNQEKALVGAFSVIVKTGCVITDGSFYSTSRKASQQSSSNPASRMFAKYDVAETSYHFYSDRIDLHFCDDPGGGRSEHPELAGGGAFQVSLARLQLDYYPYHLAR